MLRVNTRTKAKMLSVCTPLWKSLLPNLEHHFLCLAELVGSSFSYWIEIHAFWNIIVVFFAFGIVTIQLVSLIAFCGSSIALLHAVASEAHYLF